MNIISHCSHPQALFLKDEEVYLLFLTMAFKKKILSYNSTGHNESMDFKIIFTFLTYLFGNRAEKLIIKSTNSKV